MWRNDTVIEKQFFTIVMRCCWRPKMMAKALDSVIEQTFKDAEIILIPDMQKRGVNWANQQFGENTARCDGQYVYALDDDCLLSDKHVLAKMNAAIVKHAYPDVLMVKCRRPQFEPKVLPKPTVWGERSKLRVTATNGGCFVSSNEVWKQYAHKYGVRGSGDWNYLNAVNKKASLKFAWLDYIVQDMQQMGRGVKFDDCTAMWFSDIVTKYNFIEIVPGDWRLQLWKEL